MVCAKRRWETCVRVVQGLLGNILPPVCLLAAAVDQMVADDRDGVGLERSAAMIACCRMAQRDAALLKEIVIFHMAVAFGDKPCNRPVDKFQAVFYEQLLFSGQHDAASIHFVSPSFVRSKNPCKAIELGHSDTPRSWQYVRPLPGCRAGRTAMRKHPVCA